MFAGELTARSDEAVFEFKNELAYEYYTKSVKVENSCLLFSHRHGNQARGVTWNSYSIDVLRYTQIRRKRICKKK